MRAVTVEYEELEDGEMLNADECRGFDVNGLFREEDFDENLVVDLMETIGLGDDDY